jgi:hypothetical protein
VSHEPIIDETVAAALAASLGLLTPPSPDLARAAEEQRLNLASLWRADVDGVEALVPAEPPS